jgi:hypothetical protein
MKWWFNKWKQQRRWDTPHYRDYRYMDNDPFRYRRSILKQIVIAMALFGIFITFHDGEHWVAGIMNNGVRYMLNQHIDPVVLIEQAGLSKYSPGNIDLSVFKNLPVINKQKPEVTLIVPIDGKIVGDYGWRTFAKEQIFAEGIDWDAPVGTSVKAAAQGQVKSVADSTKFGKTIIIQHGNDMETFYGNCTDILVHSGDLVTQGQIIAKAGKIKDTDRARLYIEVRVKGQAIDPKTKMNIVGP